MDPKAKAFLACVPVLMVVLLAAGWRLATREPPPPNVIVVDPNEDVARIEEDFARARVRFQEGSRLEGEAGIAALREALKLLQDGLDEIRRVRDSTTDAEAGKVNRFEVLDAHMVLLLESVRAELKKRI